MNQYDFDEMKVRYKEYLENNSPAKVVYRTQDVDRVIDSRFGFVVDNGTAIEYELNANVEVNPSKKRVAQAGVASQSELIVKLSTQQLEDYQVGDLKREDSLLLYGGREYAILSIDPKPLLFNSSIMTVLGCALKEPVVA